MRIGIHAAGLLPHRTGRESYVQSLLEGLARLDRDNDYDVFVTPANRHLFERPEANIRCVEVRLPRVPSRRIWEAAWLRMSPRVRRVDLLHLVESPLPLYQPRQAVATVHDILPVLHPEFFPLKGRFFYGKALTAGTKHLRGIIAVSQQTKHDLIARLGLDSRCIHVVYPAVPPRFRPIRGKGALSAVREKYGLPERFILYVGTLEPRKNLLRLIDAYERLRRKGPAPALVLAGGKGWLCDEVVEAAGNLGGLVRLPGVIDDVDLPALYSAAELFVFPSLYEGFGMPPLEAMACGVPVVCSDRASLPEVVGDAALTVDPGDREAIASAIWEATHDAELRARMRRKGLARARRFSCEEMARGTLEVYEQLAGVSRSERERNAA